MEEEIQPATGHGKWLVMSEHLSERSQASQQKDLLPL